MSTPSTGPHRPSSRAIRSAMLLAGLVLAAGLQAAPAAQAIGNATYPAFGGGVGSERNSPPPISAPGTRSLAVLSIAGPARRAPERKRLAEALRQQLYSGGAFVPPGPGARWVDPHYGRLDACDEPLCAWRATLLLDTRWTVVGSWEEEDGRIEVDLRMVDHATGSDRGLAIRGSNATELERNLDRAVRWMRLQDAETPEEDDVPSVDPARVELQRLVEEYRSAKHRAWTFGLLGTGVLLVDAYQGRDRSSPEDSSSRWGSKTRILVGGAGIALEALAIHAWIQAVGRGHRLQDAENAYAGRRVVLAPDLSHPDSPGALIRVSF